MANQIDRNVFVKRDALKNPISYVQGTDLLPIVLHFLDFEIPAGATANVFVLKPDKTAFYGSATISGNDVTVDVDEQMFVVTGFNVLQVEIASNGKTLMNFAQPVTVKPNYKTGDSLESVTKVEWIDEAIKQAQEAANEAQQAAKDSETAIENSNIAITGANQAAQNANETAQELKDKAAAGDFDGPQGPSGTMTIGGVQTLQPDEEATVTNTGTPENAVLNFGIPRGEDGMTDLTAEYKDNSSYTCQPTVNAPVVVKELDGKTEQGENPSPDNPQVIKGVGGMGYFDGEWRQGNISSTGTVGTGTTGITSANAIPCKQNDNIAVTYEDSIDVIAVAFYNASGAYISTSTSGNSVDAFTATAPANTASCKVNLRVASGGTITPSAAKYCTVTINGEYQTGVEVMGKNFANVPKENLDQTAQLNIPKFKWTGKNQIYFKYSASTNQADGGIAFRATYFDKNGNKMGSNGNGFKPGTGFTERSSFFDGVGAGTQGGNVNLSKVDYIYCDISIQSASATQFSIKDLMISDSDLTNTDYTPYHHTALTIPLTSPLYEGDRLCYVKPGESYVDADGTTVIADRILYGCYRENASVVFDGSEDEKWEIYASEQYSGFRIEIEDMKENIYNDGFSNLFPVQKSSTNDPGIWLGSTSAASLSDYMYVHNVNPTYATDVGGWKAWLQSHNMTVLYPIATPYFEPFSDQSIFYDLRTDDTLSYVYSNDPIEPNVAVEVAKNSTGGYLLESYAQAQKNAISEANSQSRLSAIEQQLVNQATAPTE